MHDVDWVLVGWLLMLGCGIAGMLLCVWGWLRGAGEADEELERAAGKRDKG